MSIVQEIRLSLDEAEKVREKTAMFHLQILKNAQELEGMNAQRLCHELGLPKGYSREFTKMINLAQLMRELGIRLVE